jgi:hypothetical protein
MRKVCVFFGNSTARSNHRKYGPSEQISHNPFVARVCSTKSQRTPQKRTWNPRPYVLRRPFMELTAGNVARPDFWLRALDGALCGFLVIYVIVLHRAQGDFTGSVCGRPRGSARKNRSYTPSR